MEPAMSISKYTLGATLALAATLSIGCGNKASDVPTTPYPDGGYVYDAGATFPPPVADAGPTTPPPPVQAGPRGRRQCGRPGDSRREEQLLSVAVAGARSGEGHREVEGGRGACRRAALQQEEVTGTSSARGRRSSRETLAASEPQKANGH